MEILNCSIYSNTLIWIESDEWASGLMNPPDSPIKLGREGEEAGRSCKQAQVSNLLRLLALGGHYDWNFQILSKNFRLFFFFLTKWNMIQHAKKGFFLIEKIKEVRYNSDLFNWSLILLSWKAKVSHNFWTKFGNANRSCTSNRRACWQKACTQKQDELLINKDEKSHFF